MTVMLTFLLLATVLLCLALGLLLPPLMRRAPSSTPATHGNLDILREQLRQLETEFAQGQLTAGQHRQARTELECRVLEEEGGPRAALATPLRSVARTAWALVLLVPLSAAGLYAQLGNRQAMAQAEAAPNVAQLNVMVDKLAQRMAQDPGNLEGWTQLGRAYALMQRFEEARQANDHAMTLGPPGAQLLVDQAHVLSMLQGQDLAEESARLVERALTLDPRNIKALAMAGSAAFERQDFALAVQRWSEALQLVPASSEIARSLQTSLAAAREALQEIPDAAPRQGPRITGTVVLAPELAGRVKEGDTLFIFARAVQGPRAPLAVWRGEAKGFPLRFQLDDSQAMSPQLRLSTFPTVVVGARISSSGDALPRSGDLIGQGEPTGHASQDVLIQINSVQP